jgi:hypothetical protein
MKWDLYAVEYISGQLKIARRTARMLLQTYNGLLPTGNFLQELDLGHGPGGEDVIIKEVWWRTYKWFHMPIFMDVLSRTTGSADLMLISEDIEIEGLRVRDGKVEEKAVRITFVD